MIELRFLVIADRIERELRTRGEPLSREASGRLDDKARNLALEIREALEQQVNRRKGKQA